MLQAQLTIRPSGCAEIGRSQAVPTNRIKAELGHRRVDQPDRSPSRSAPRDDG